MQKPKPSLSRRGKSTSHPKKSQVKSHPFWLDPLTGLQHSSKINDRCQYFHSVLEFRLYCQFKQALGNQVQIVRQYSLLYKPATGRYKELYWKVDFCLKEVSSSHCLYVEAKGEWLLHDSGAFLEFQHKLQFLEYSNPSAYENLILIGASSLRIDKLIQAIDEQSAIKLIQEKLCQLKTSKS